MPACPDRRLAEASPTPIAADPSSSALVLSVPVAAVMKRDPILVARGAPMAAVRALFRHHTVDTFPVLDERGELVGLLHRSACMRHGAQDTGIAADHMRPMSQGLSPDAPVPLAAAVLSHERLPGIAIVDERGVVVGVVEDVDLLGWIALQGAAIRATVPGRRT